MINMIQKNKIIKLYLQGSNFSTIAKEAKCSRATVRKYVNEYIEIERQIQLTDDEMLKEELIVKANQKPSYNVTNRSKYVYNKEIDDLIDYYLEQNELKRKKRQYKMLMKNIDIHREIVKLHNISYSTVNNAINKKLNKKKETFIKSFNVPGAISEFDWGDVTLVIDEISKEERRYKIGVFTLKYSNYVYAQLYASETTDCFKDIHASYIEHLGGITSQIVYDNARVQVRRLAGNKYPTKALETLMNYYGFKHRFTNDYSGNEKGSVERYVEYVRRRAFSVNNRFKTFEDARIQLCETISMINNEEKQRKETTPQYMLEEEKLSFLPNRVKYDVGENIRVMVNKYSFIYVDSCFYSVPEFLTGKEISIKKYPMYIKVLYNDKVIEIIDRIWKRNEYKIDITHYLSTLKKKPGSLANSLALKQVESELQTIFHNYFNTNPKDFIVVLELIKQYSQFSVFTAIRKLELLNIEINSQTIKCQLLDIEMLNYKIENQKDIVSDCSSHLHSISTLFNQESKEMNL